MPLTHFKIEIFSLGSFRYSRKFIIVLRPFIVQELRVFGFYITLKKNVPFVFIGNKSEKPFKALSKRNKKITVVFGRFKLA